MGGPDRSKNNNMENSDRGLQYHANMAGKGEINGQRGRQCRKMLRPETFAAFHISVHIYITKAIIKKSGELNIHIYVVIITVIKYLFTI